MLLTVEQVMKELGCVRFVAEIFMNYANDLGVTHLSFADAYKAIVKDIERDPVKAMERSLERDKDIFDRTSLNEIKQDVLNNLRAKLTAPSQIFDTPVELLSVILDKFPDAVFFVISLENGTVRSAGTDSLSNAKMLASLAMEAGFPPKIFSRKDLEEIVIGMQQHMSGGQA